MSSPSRSRRALLRVLGGTALAGMIPATGTATTDESFVFFVQSFEPGEIELERGETFDVQTTILNTGRPGTQTVQYRIEDETVRSRELTLDRGESAQLTFEQIETEGLDTGGLTHGIYTEDASDRAPLVVRGPPFFQVTEVRPRLGNTLPGEQFSVSATVTNTGEGGGQQTVSLVVDGERLASEPVSLDIDESQGVTFTVEAPAEPGEYRHSIQTDDDNATGAVTVLDQAARGSNSTNELLYALGGGGGALALCGAYWLLRSRQGGRPADSTDTNSTDADSGRSGASDSMDGQIAVGDSAGSSSVIESAIEENLERAETAIADAERYQSRSEYSKALAACYRARVAIEDAADAAREYAPDRIETIESRTEDVDDIVATIESELED